FPRERERESDERGRSRAGGPGLVVEAAASDDPRDVFTRDLDVPRGRSRERIRANAREYSLSGDDVRTLATVGAFRVVSTAELREPNPRSPTRPARDLERLRDIGLLRTMPYVVGHQRTTLVTLSAEGRALLEQARRPGGDTPSQAFYAGVSKPRELAHDTRVYSAYQKAAERLAARGARIHRVVLEEEFKRDYQRFLRAETISRRRSGG